MININTKPPLSDSFYMAGKVFIIFRAVLLIAAPLIEGYSLHPIMSLVLAVIYIVCLYFVLRVMWNAGEKSLAKLIAAMMLFSLFNGLFYFIYSSQLGHLTIDESALYINLFTIIRIPLFLIELILGVYFLIRGKERGKHLISVGVILVFTPLASILSQLIIQTYSYIEGGNSDDFAIIGLGTYIISLLLNLLFMCFCFNFLYREQILQRKTADEFIREELF